MNVLLDTSVLFPAVSAQHPNHLECANLVNSLHKKGTIFVLNTHLIAELYSNLTRIPQLRISTDAARNLIKSLATQFEPITLDVTDYLNAVDRCADFDLSGGIIYDALHFEAALKAEVEILYTYNLKDFIRLKAEDIPFKIEVP